MSLPAAEGDAVRNLVGLLGHFSPTGQESGASAYLAAWMGASGFQTSVDAVGNAVGTLGSGPSEIVLLGHIDTVAGEIPVRQDGERLYGRGAVDAKGPLACFVSAVSRVNVPTGSRITVIGAVAEEGDSHGAKYRLKLHRPAAAVIGEPSGWERITLGYKGSLWLDYAVCQPLAHTAGQSSSACEAAVQFWQSVRQMAAAYNGSISRVFDQVNSTLRGMNSHSDGFHETAELKIGVRLPPAVSVAEIEARVAALAGNGRVHFGEGVAACKADKNTPLVRAMLAAIRRAGGQPGFSLKTGTSDMNLAAPAWDCPIAAYGPGDSSLDHTPEEHIFIPEYLRSITVLADALQTLVDSLAGGGA